MPDTLSSTLLEASSRIGPYRVLQVLGEGGMGVVYEAEQLTPVHRRIALKAIRPGMDSREVIARFEAERQALAVMSHPGIARVLDAGETDAGSPYFVMELVPGVPITEYCDAHELGLRDRLALFVAVCEGVQHAHQKGVIHRDLKPSNVLVTEIDGTAQPKIIDFGIAKATGQRLTEKTLVTMHGQALGTAAYMSPEQAEHSGLDVDTRADVYSLGVMLYELLAGQLPLDPDQVGVLPFIAQLVSRDTEVPAPSVKFATTTWNRDRLAKLRHTDAEGLRRALAHDLDWIVLKAMEKDRARRYESATALAADVGRYLADEPIAARPPSTAYRLKKFVRRHRGGVAATTIGMLAIVAGAVASTLGFVRATHAEAAARQEATASRQVSDFLVNVFRVSHPGAAIGNSVTARELLDSGAARASRDLAAQPVVEARMLYSIGAAYGALGLYDQARSLLDSAVQLRTRAVGPRDTSVARALTALAQLEYNRGDYAAAERMLRQAIAIDSVAGPGGPGGLRFDLATLAAVKMLQRQDSAAGSYYGRALAIDSTLPHSDTLRVADLLGLGITVYHRKDYGRATRVLQEALAIESNGARRDRALGPIYTALGTVEGYQGRHAEALSWYERARSIMERLYGVHHPQYALMLGNVGYAQMHLGHYAAADTVIRAELAIQEPLLAPDSPQLANTREELAEITRELGKYAESDSLFRTALVAERKAFGPGSSTVVDTENEYAQLLRRAGRARAADSLAAIAAARR